MKKERIQVHAGEGYPYSFDFTGWIAADDKPVEVVDVQQVSKAPGTAPDLVIGASEIAETGEVMVWIEVHEDAPKGVEYELMARVNTLKGGTKQRCHGLLEVVG